MVIYYEFSFEAATDGLLLNLVLGEKNEKQHQL